MHPRGEMPSPAARARGHAGSSCPPSWHAHRLHSSSGVQADLPPRIRTTPQGQSASVVENLWPLACGSRRIIPRRAAMWSGQSGNQQQV
jgi:hypothetical protein